MCRKGYNIYHRADGRWEGRYKKGRRDDGRLIFGYCYGKSYREVKKRLIEIESENLFDCSGPARLRKEMVVKKDGKTFGEYCWKWIKSRRMEIKGSSYNTYYNMLYKHIVPDLGHLLPIEVNSEKIEAFTEKLLYEKGQSPKSVKNILIILRLILKYVESMGGEVVSDVRVVMPKVPKKESRVLTVDEEHKLMQYLMKDMDNFKFSVLLALMTGLRVGEMCALKWKDVDVDEGCIVVRNTMLRLKKSDQYKEGVLKEGKKTSLLLTEPKSESSKRSIPLTGYLKELCKARKPASGEGFVASGSDKIIEPRLLHTKIKQYAEECGIEDVHFHTLRHSFATRCVEMGVDIKSLSEILGHSGTNITLQEYVHSSMDFKTENMKKLDGLWK